MLNSFSCSSATASVIPLLTDKRIVDDTSIAVLTLPNGDRHLFFQEHSGLIRQAYYSSTSREWRADSSNVVAANAKNHTPLAAVHSPAIDDTFSNNPETVSKLSLRSIFCTSLVLKEIAGGILHITKQQSCLYILSANRRCMAESDGHDDTCIREHLTIYG